MKDLGEAAYILGIKIYRDRSRRLIALNQTTYIEKMLNKYSMANAKKGLLPILKGRKLSKTQCPVTDEEIEKMKDIPYASAVGSIMYAMLCTRPDVALAISMAGRFQSNPGKEHWLTVKGILKYLKRTKDMSLVYGGNDDELAVMGYVDASFDSDPDDHKSQSGYIFMLNGGAVSWRSGKQSSIAQSTMESEYMAAAEASNEAVWLREFVIELGVFPSMRDPVNILCDNTGAIANAKDPRNHSVAKHIPQRYHVIREHVQNGKVKVSKVDTDLNAADPLTKPLPQEKFDQHREAIGVRVMPGVIMV